MGKIISRSNKKCIKYSQRKLILNIIFTLCSNNYLAQAKTLGDSLLKYNPGYKFIIGLVDELSKEVDYNFFKPYTIIPAAQIGIPDFDSLWKKYSIVEFNTCAKA